MSTTVMSAKMMLVFNLLCMLLCTSVYCLYFGDNCMVDGEAGICLQLKRCQTLMDEVHAGGTPLPRYVRRKLQDASCGFEGSQPLVCCVRSSDYRFDWSDTRRQGASSYGDISNTNSKEFDTVSWNSVTDRNDRVDSYNIRPKTTIRPAKRNEDDINHPKAVPDISRHPNLNLLPTNCGKFDDNRILGGNKVALYEMPWMVLFTYESSQGIKLSCGGTLVTRWYILTAAHCVTHLSSSMRLRGAILGEHDVTVDPDCEGKEEDLHCAPSAVNVTFEKTIPHPGYTPQSFYDDIALVKLSRPADFSLDNIKPICLPTTRELMEDNLIDKAGVVAGWGATENGIQSSVLLQVELPVMNNSDCQTAYKGNVHIYTEQMCAGGLEDKDSCGGDSGGPLIYPGRTSTGDIRHVQRGIVSFGSTRCGVKSLPGVYTRVAYYMDWILDNIDE